MANSAFEANPAFTKLGEDARNAVAQAFDAMSNWRAELAERHGVKENSLRPLCPLGALRGSNQNQGLTTEFTESTEEGRRAGWGAWHDGFTVGSDPSSRP